MRSRRAWYFSNSWLVADCFRDRPYDFFFFFFWPCLLVSFRSEFFVLFVWFCPHSLSRLVFRSACEALLAIPGVFGCYLAVSRYFLFGLCGLACRLPARFAIILLFGRRGHPLLPCYHPVGLFVQLLSYFGSIRKLVLFFFFVAPRMMAELPPVSTTPAVVTPQVTTETAQSSGTSSGQTASSLTPPTTTGTP